MNIFFKKKPHKSYSWNLTKSNPYNKMGTDYTLPDRFWGWFRRAGGHTINLTSFQINATAYQWIYGHFFSWPTCKDWMYELRLYKPKEGSQTRKAKALAQRGAQHQWQPLTGSFFLAPPEPPPSLSLLLRAPPSCGAYMFSLEVLPADPSSQGSTRTFPTRELRLYYWPPLNCELICKRGASLFLYQVSKNICWKMQKWQKSSNLLFRNILRK